MFDCIIITATDHKKAAAYEAEIARRKGVDLPKATFIVVPDPMPGNVMGSGGITMNALFHAAEHLAAVDGYGAISVDALIGKRILIVHSGGASGDIPYQALCGESWSSLPFVGSKDDSLNSIDAVLDSLVKLSENCPPGMFVCMSKSIFSVPDDYTYDWSESGVTVLAIPGPIELSPRFGVFLHAPNSTEVLKYYQHFQPKEILSKKAYYKNEKQVLIDTGVIFFDIATTTKLFELHSNPPLDACTLSGIDEGAEPLCLNLFGDYLMALGGNEKEVISDEEYFKRQTCDPKVNTVNQARHILREELKHVKFHVTIIENALITRLDSMREILNFCRSFKSCWPKKITHNIHSITNLENEDQNIIFNSIIDVKGKIGNGNLIEDTKIEDGYLEVGNNCIISGIKSFDIIYLKDNMCMQEVQYIEEDNNNKVNSLVFLLSIDDQPLIPYKQPNSTFMNKPWEIFFKTVNITADDIWPHIQDEDKRCLYNAKLYPFISSPMALNIILWMQDYSVVSPSTYFLWKSAKKFSIEDIMEMGVPNDAFQWKWDLYCEVGRKITKDILTNRKHKQVKNIFEYIAHDSKQLDLYLREIDEIASSSSIDITARCFSWISDLLVASVSEIQRIRSGPGNNSMWSHPHLLLQQHKVKEAIEEMSVLRTQWLKHPEFVIRAARHYIGLCQILISQCVLQTPRTILEDNFNEKPKIGVWVEHKSAARLNLMGGWLDLPPITYELPHLAIVLETAILLDGKRPLRAYVRRIQDLRISLVPLPGSHRGQVDINCLDDMKDYCQPAAPGALIKSALLALKIVDLSVNKTLQEQLMEKVGGGLEIAMTSVLPKGCGLGGSSILAACLVSSLCKVCSIRCSWHFMMYTVLAIEQLLTSGGGWADQAGIYPGFAITACDNKLPIQLTVHPVTPAKSLVETLNHHLLFIYSGHARLARNLVQNVIREWYGSSPHIMEACREMMEYVQVGRKAIETGDLPLLGKVLSIHAKNKIILSHGNPPFVEKIMKAIEPACYGVGICGAGGGGFINCITKNADAVKEVEELMRNAGCSMIGIHFSYGTIDTEGMEFNLLEQLPQDESYKC